ncbi:MAG: hypothetical protein ACRDSH_18405 [Pseudonocardiaceae bacterium]
MSHQHPVLELVGEARIADLLGAGEASARLEASGVLVRDGLCHVVFDNLSVLGLFDGGLAVPGVHRLVELTGGRGADYEDLAYDTATGRLFVLIESLPDGPPFRACVEEYDARYRLVASKRLDFPLERPNKGIEGLTCVRRDERLHLLGLCEGNQCRSGEECRAPGDGRIQVFTEGPRMWERIATIPLPRTVRFRDYAGIALAGDHIAVVSQESSALWVGQLAREGWSVVGDGTVYDFPRDGEGRLVYREIEGVSWLERDRIVVVSDRAKSGGPRRRAHGESIAVFTIPHPAPADPSSGLPPAAPPPVRGLFLQPVSGDGALLRLARLRFAQARMPAEVYAGSSGQLEDVLRWAPDSPVLPTVHLDRRLDVRTEDGRAVIGRFQSRFANRVAGLVVHDKAGMAEAIPGVVAALRSLGGRTDRPTVYLEYAAGMDLERFAEIGEQVQDVEGVGLCIDTGHVGIRRARSRFAMLHPGLHISELTTVDPRLPDLVGEVQDATAAALPALLHLINATAEFGATVHYHLHDGHPLIPGLADHRSFLYRLPIPFAHDGRCSLDPLYGPAGLARILHAAVQAGGAHPPSFTLEIHQAEGRLPLDDAADLFRHWRDLTNAERMNYWLSVITANYILATTALGDLTPGIAKH